MFHPYWCRTKTPMEVLVLIQGNLKIKGSVMTTTTTAIKLMTMMMMMVVVVTLLLLLLLLLPLLLLLLMMVMMMGMYSRWYHNMCCCQPYCGPTKHCFLPTVFVFNVNIQHRCENNTFNNMQTPVFFLRFISFSVIGAFSCFINLYCWGCDWLAVTRMAQGQWIFEGNR